MLSDQITNLIDNLGTKFGSEMKNNFYEEAKKIWTTLDLDDRRDAQSRFYKTASEAYSSRRKS